MIRIPLPHRWRPMSLALGIALTVTPAMDPTRLLASPSLPDAATARAMRSMPLPYAGHASGLWVTLDPVTRKPVAPTAEQRRAIQEALREATLAPAAPDRDAFLPVQRIPGGGQLIQLDGRHMVFAVARRDASGRFVTTCATDSVDASRALPTKAMSHSKPASAARHAEER